MNSASARARGDTVPRKHVDFSLGMRDVTAEDMDMGDVFEDRGSRVNDVVRDANREAHERRVQAIREEEEERRSSQASSPKPGRTSNLSLPSHREGEPRRSGESQSVRSVSSARNRFFRHRSSIGNERADLMEQGRYEQEQPSPAPGYQQNQPPAPQY